MQEFKFLPDHQIDAFRRDGFVIVRGVLGPDEAARVRRWVDEVQTYPEVKGKYMVYHEESISRPGARVLDRTENFVPYHDGLAGLVNSPALLGRVSELFGAPAILFKEKINYKLPDGRGFAPHQDMQAGWGKYASLFVTALVAVDPATADNGCLELVAGQHQRGLIGDKWRPLEGEKLMEMEFVPCILEPGDMVFFDSFAPHRSAPNRSSLPRRALYVTYNRLREGDHRIRYYADKRKNFPPDCEREPGKVYKFKV